jgi:hypothetical protein
LEGITVKLLPSGATSTGDGFIEGTNRGQRRLISVNPSDQSFLARLALASQVELSHPKFGTLRKPLREPAAAAKSLTRCEDEKMREWGIDPDAWRALKTRPVQLTSVPELRRSIEHLVWRTGRSRETVVTRLTIATDGTARECVSVNPRADQDLAQRVCAAFKRHMRFAPAVDQSGHLAESYYVTKVSFEIRL